MPARRSIRVTITVGVIAATALTTAGVTYAATSTSGTVKACVSAKGALSLLSAKGTCARGSRAVSINEQGRTGAPGKTGKQGPKGNPGVSAPAPISIALDTTDTAASSKTFAIGSTGMTVAGSCLAGSDAGQLVLSGNSDYYVHGAAQYLDAGSADLAAQTVQPNGSQTIPSGASLIAYESSANSVIEVYVPKPTIRSSGTVQLYSDLVVLTGGESFSIHLYEYFDGARCQLSAQVIAP